MLPTTCELSAAEEAEVQALLRQTQRTQPAAAAPAALPMDTQPRNCYAADLLRDQLVLDAACGGSEGWTTVVAARDVDFTEQDTNGTWSASISIVLSLLRYTGADTTEHSHDETGTGRVDGMPSEDAAIETAEQRAISNATRRLAKRFAISLDPNVIAAIYRESGGTTLKALMPAKSKWSKKAAPSAAGAR